MIGWIKYTPSKKCGRTFIQYFLHFIHFLDFGTHILCICVCGGACHSPQYRYQCENKEEILSGTLSEDSVTLCLSSLRQFTMKMHSSRCFTLFVFFICKKRSVVNTSIPSGVS